MVKLPGLKKFANMAFSGLAISSAPAIVKGMLVEYLKNVTLEEIIYEVENNRVLWVRIDPEMQQKTINMLSRLGNLDWLNADFVIESIKDEHPAMASLFLGWEEARVWLEKQASILKQETA